MPRTAPGPSTLIESMMPPSSFLTLMATSIQIYKFLNPLNCDTEEAVGTSTATPGTDVIETFF